MSTVSLSRVFSEEAACNYPSDWKDVLEKGEQITIKNAKGMIRTGLEEAARQLFKNQRPSKSPPTSNPEYIQMMSAIGTLHFHHFQAAYPEMLLADDDVDDDTTKIIEVEQVSLSGFRFTLDKACMLNKDRNVLLT